MWQEKKDLKNKKRKVLENGKVWYNGDGSITNSDGSISLEKKAKTGDVNSGNSVEQIKLVQVCQIQQDDCLYDEEHEEDVNNVVHLSGI